MNNYSLPSRFLNEISNNEINIANTIKEYPPTNINKKITSDNVQLSPGKKRMLEFLKKNSNVSIHYGKDGTGNLYNLDNIIDFKNTLNNSSSNSLLSFFNTLICAFKDAAFTDGSNVTGCHLFSNSAFKSLASLSCPFENIIDSSFLMRDS